MAIEKEIKIDLDNNPLIPTQSTVITIGTPISQGSSGSDIDNELVKNMIDNRVDLLKSESFITPQEYYQELSQAKSVSDNKQEGYYILDPTMYQVENLGWFWIEDLKNWGRYYIDCISYPSVNIITLSLWNGKNGWIDIPDFYINKYDFNEKTIKKKNTQDYFNIGKIQDSITAKLIAGDSDALPLTVEKLKNTIIGERGILESVNIKLKETDNIHGNIGTIDGFKPVYNNDTSVPQQTIHAFRLQKSMIYSINEVGTFQTRRWNSSSVSYTQHFPEVPKDKNEDVEYITDIRIQPKKLMDAYKKTVITEAQYLRAVHPELLPRSNVGTFANSNFRIGIPIAVPTIWRLPTGELSLCTTLSYNGDSGVAYTYKKDATGFKKVPFDVNPNLDGLEFDGINLPKNGYKYEYLGSLDCYKMFGHDEFAASKWLNDMCAIYFGNGNDKSIEKDWLNLDTIDESDISFGVDEVDGMLDSGKVFEQHNINKENSLKCTITVNRPVVTTEENPHVDYVKKW